MVPAYYYIVLVKLFFLFHQVSGYYIKKLSVPAWLNALFIIISLYYIFDPVIIPDLHTAFSFISQLILLSFFSFFRRIKKSFTAFLRYIYVNVNAKMKQVLKIFSIESIKRLNAIITKRVQREENKSRKHFFACAVVKIILILFVLYGIYWFIFGPFCDTIFYYLANDVTPETQRGMRTCPPTLEEYLRLKRGGGPKPKP